jgi:hypothetical protein
MMKATWHTVRPNTHGECTMLSAFWFIYKPDDGTMYKLRIEFTRGIKRVTILGAEIYKMDGIYIGYWDAFNIPLKIQEEMRAFIRRREPMNEKSR